MPDQTAPSETLDQITASARALARNLRTSPTPQARRVAAQIRDGQDLAETALQCFLNLATDQPRPTTAELLLLDRVAHMAKAAQDASAELTAALARSAQNRRRHAATTSAPVVLIGPSPQQFITSAADLLDRIPALRSEIQRNRLTSPTP